MYLASYAHDGKLKYGFRTNDERSVVDAVEAEKQLFSDAFLPGTLREVIENQEAVTRLRQLHRKISQDSADYILPLSDVTLEAPIPNPKRDIICLGLNYHEHALEYTTAMEAEKNVPQNPIVFTKATTTVIGPNQKVKSHRNVTSQIDYEAELAIVIGKQGTNIPAEEAYDYILGYTIINDVTARDLQKKHSQWFLGKGLDTFGPMGPYLVTADEIAAPVNLNIQCRVNGEVRQNSNTELLIFDIPTIIKTISAGITLQPGDIIATGTPKGVGIGFNPPRFLQEGDVVEVEIEKIGILKNTVA
ncbi:fumarylacetoacetate hydrolase family protein [Aneurinibacillus sp. Ricciae_BoGa-3]|uniref:fumarylacetoacetate hydrolase family protein n=1 Tax=Aneurinibacillus sp. Ricciae_BoGa-3 TaxID=3022697 RepID=UPI00234191D3|nr:fumarylacetoacetate hydrolase family protein [Aneurinibacillus sp. Ricciae_BoGa-3]WCK53735.1 fumarylacetoacetate hydrolase family protein [Aneurinibacillus sp. Ricciae_BoGa-3]